MKTCRKLVFLICLVAASSAVHAQDVLWSKNYGGPYNEGGYGCHETSDGNFVIAGSTFSYGHGDHDFYLVKLDTLGETLWTRTFGGTSADYGHDIDQTPDGGFIIVGTTLSFGAGKEDIYLIRTDAQGDTIWTKTFGGIQTDEGWSVRVTSDSNVIICGTTSSSGAGYADVWLLKVNLSGNLLWTKTFGGAGGESGFAVRETPDNGFIAVGATGSFGEGYSSIYAIRTNANGDSLWAKTYGGPKADFGYSVEVTLDGGFIFAGATGSYGLGYYDAYVVKTDANGNFEWDKTYGGAKDDRAYGISITSDGGYLVVGTTESFGAGLVDQYAIKIDPIGTEMWHRTFGGTQSDYCRMALVTSKNDFLLTGYSYSYSAGGSDLYILKIEGEASTDVYEPRDRNLPEGFDLAQNYPNPFNLSTTISFTLPRASEVAFSIYNIIGQVVKEYPAASLSAGTYTLQWDGTNDHGNVTASGIYFYRIQTAKWSATKKMVLLK
jgi:hypothetical protein